MHPCCQPPNCFRMTASRELFDSSVGLVTTNALVLTGLATIRVGKPRVILKWSEKFSNPAKSGYNKGTISANIRYLVVSKDVRRHRLISSDYIKTLYCHGR